MTDDITTARARLARPSADPFTIGAQPGGAPITIPGTGNTFITGRSGSGKTLLAKTLAAYTLERPNTAVIVVSPYAKEFGLQGRESTASYCDNLAQTAEEIAEWVQKGAESSEFPRGGAYRLLVLDELALRTNRIARAAHKILTFAPAAGIHTVVTSPPVSLEASALRSLCRTTVILQPDTLPAHQLPEADMPPGRYRRTYSGMVLVAGEPAVNGSIHCYVEEEGR